MRHNRMLPLLVLSSVLAVPALASMGGGGGGSAPSMPSSSTDPASTDGPTVRQQAERAYGDAYSEIAKAKKDLADKKDDNAKKRFTKALGRAREAVGLDSTYHEAWNLVGYASRKLGKYDDAVAAYQTCLGIAYDYAPAREYLGEAYLEMGKPDLARQQLAVLERLKATDETAELTAAVNTYAAAHPEAAAPAATASAGSSSPVGTAIVTSTPSTATTPAAADSTGSK